MQCRVLPVCNIIWLVGWSQYECVKAADVLCGHWSDYRTTAWTRQTVKFSWDPRWWSGGILRHPAPVTRTHHQVPDLTRNHRQIDIVPPNSEFEEFWSNIAYTSARQQTSSCRRTRRNWTRTLSEERWSTSSSIYLSKSTYLSTLQAIEELSAEKLMEYREIFSFFDRDGGGSIGAEEFQQVMRTFGWDPREDELKVARVMCDV